MRIRPAPPSPAGEVITLRHRSRVLEGNPWDDPVERDHKVYLPPGYRDSDASYPVFWCLAAFTNSGPGMVGWKNFSESLPERLDRLINTRAMGPVIVAFPDAFTSLGGNQYVNSSGLGNYADYLVEELIPWLETEVRCRPGREYRAAFGKSSGGYGALFHGMHYASHWGAVASHAGDVGFDLCYRSDFGHVATTLAGFDRDPERFLRAFWETGRVTGAQIGALMCLAMAASYDPDPSHPPGIRLPFDLETGELDRERWERWLAYDPLEMAEAGAGDLQSLKGLYIDCGTRDQFHMQYGSRRLSRKLDALDVPHVYEEFDGTHSGIDYRFDVSLPYLYRRLTGR